MNMDNDDGNDDDDGDDLFDSNGVLRACTVHRLIFPRHSAFKWNYVRRIHLAEQIEG